MKKPYLGILGFFFVVSLFLNHFYGPFLYSRLLGKEDDYEIGKLCYESRDLCENIYFKSHVDEINDLSKQPDNFFADLAIKESVSNYSGNCPCPYSTDLGGNSCGDGSAYSKDGGSSPYCYLSDISIGYIDEIKYEMITDAVYSLNNAVNQYIRVYKEKSTLLFIILIFGYLFWIFYKKHER